MAHTEHFCASLLGLPVFAVRCCCAWCASPLTVVCGSLCLRFRDCFVPSTELEEAVLLLSVCYRCECVACVKHKQQVLADITIALCRARQHDDLSEVWETELLERQRRVV